MFCVLTAVIYVCGKKFYLWYFFKINFLHYNFFFNV